LVVQAARFISVHHQARAPQVLGVSLAPQSRNGRTGALTSPDTLLFSDYGQDRNDGIPENPGGIQILFREAPPVHAGRRQPFEVPQGGRNTFAAQTVKGPEEQEIKFACPSSPG
jgi:hypothetical protein